MKPDAELKALRQEMGYSMAGMAELMGIGKSTYQGYETGRRAMPAGFINSVREWQQIDLDFYATMDNRIDGYCRQDGFGNGIPNEARG